MKKLARKFKAFKACIKDNLRFNLAPYCVINSRMKKEHFCWTWEQALKYVAAYNADVFGVTRVHSWNGNLIASKG